MRKPAEKGNSREKASGQKTAGRCSGSPGVGIPSGRGSSKCNPVFKSCSCSGKNLDRFLQPAILLLIRQRACHGYQILRQLEKMPFFFGEKPDPAGVYRILGILKKNSFVTFAWETPRRGPARRTFSITPQGRACLAQWLETLTTLRDALDFFLAQARGRKDSVNLEVEDRDG